MGSPLFPVWKGVASSGSLLASSFWRQKRVPGVHDSVPGTEYYRPVLPVGLPLTPSQLFADWSDFFKLDYCELRFCVGSGSYYNNIEFAQPQALKSPFLKLDSTVCCVGTNSAGAFGGKYVACLP